MPSTKSSHARRRDRLAMAGPAIPSRLAKWIPIMISDEVLQASKKKRKWCGRREAKPRTVIPALAGAHDCGCQLFARIAGLSQRMMISLR